MHSRGVLTWLTFLVASIGLNAAAAGAETAVSTAGWKDLGQGILLENKTQLRWTKSDNGQDIVWEDARSYCARMGDGWRLPRMDELTNMFAAAERDGETTACGNAVCKAPPSFHLSSSWFWSGDAVTKDESYDHDELAWGLTLVNGSRTMALRFVSFRSRALCVRGS